MHLLTFTSGSGPRLGVLDADGATLIDLSVAAPALPSDMTALIRLGAEGLNAVAQARRDAPAGARLAVGDVTVLAPIPEPRRDILCVGKNYHEHAKEFHSSGFDSTAGAAAVPDNPIVFTKATTSVTGPNTPIPASADPTRSVDYEGELAVVIGTGGKGIAKADAYAHVYGYTVINDVTSRELQSRHKQWLIGKSLDGFCPMGPALVTADEIGDVTALRLTTTVNGEVRQSASVADLIFDIPTLIETLSATMTLLPGDIIATGTPAGVGIGFSPARFLKPGDEVTVNIDKIGTLHNTVE